MQRHFNTDLKREHRSEKRRSGFQLSPHRQGPPAARPGRSAPPLLQQHSSELFFTVQPKVNFLLGEGEFRSIKIFLFFFFFKMKSTCKSAAWTMA